MFELYRCISNKSCLLYLSWNCMKGEGAQFPYIEEKVLRPCMFINQPLVS
jgi:hypothetical protein